MKDQDLEAIADAGRRTRVPTPRWVWILAAVIGGACAIAFAVVMLDAGTPTATPAPSGVARTGGFGAGVVLGLGAGIAIGLTIARQLRGHSSRRRP